MAVGGGGRVQGVETAGCCREATRGANSPSAGMGPVARLWDAPGLRLMRVEAGRLSALVAARRWDVGA